jgi:hypothetical protein
MILSAPILLKKSRTEAESSQVVSTLKTETEESIDVIIGINEKKSIEEEVEEAITIKVNNKSVTLENSASTEEGTKFIDDLQQLVEEGTLFGKKLTFWHAAEKVEKVTEPIAEAEAETKGEVQDEKDAPHKQDVSDPCGFIQGKLMFWQAEAAKEQSVSDGSKQEDETKPAETEKKEVGNEASGHKIEVFIDGVAVQTIRLTNAGMDQLKNFIASVKEECKGASEALSKSWLVEKMTEFFESTKNQDGALENGKTSGETPSKTANSAPSSGETATPSDSAPSPGKTSTPSDSAPSPGKTSTPSDSAISPGETSTPSDSATLPGETSTPSDSATSSGKTSTSSDSAPIKEENAEIVTSKAKRSWWLFSKEMEATEELRQGTVKVA